MKVNDCIEAMINLELDAMVWEIDNCPVKVLNDIYVRNGNETHVVLAAPRNLYIAYRMMYGGMNNIPSVPEPITRIKLNDDYYFHIITTDDKEQLELLERARQGRIKGSSEDGTY